MPLAHRALSQWYHQLAQQLEVGLSLTEALRNTSGVGMPSGVLLAMAQRIEAGGGVESAFEAAAAELPAEDRTVLIASAEAARLPHVLARLSTRHAQLHAVKIRFVLACLYPLAVVHLGAILLPLAGMIDWQKGFSFDLNRYLLSVASLLVPLWFAIIATNVLARRRHPLIGRLVRAFPLLRTHARHQALADLAFSLGNFLEAGMSIERAWRVVEAQAASPELRAAAAAMVATINRGAAPGTQLGAWPCFPPDFVARYRTGETTGRLDECLGGIEQDYQDRANRSLTVAAIALPVVAFAVVAALVAYSVIKIFAGYVKLIEQAAS